MPEYSVENEYLVRGALLQCTMGSHPRRMNLPKCHGTYVLNHPMIRKDDCQVESHISYFGVCSSHTPPDGAEEILLVGFIPECDDREAADVQGLKCMPDILGEWRGVNEQTYISGNFQAVTTDSYLVCACGGLIQPITSGQEYED